MRLRAVDVVVVALVVLALAGGVFLGAYAYEAPAAIDVGPTAGAGGSRP